MKRSLVFIAIIALAAFALSGCQFVIGFIFEADVSVQNIEPAYNGGEFTGVDITFKNEGAAEDDVSYDVVLSEDPNADDRDHVLYSDYFNIGFKDSHGPVWVPTASMNLDGLDLPPGDYYIGVILDLEDGDNSNNDLTTRDSIPYPWEGGGGLDPDFADEYSPFDNDYWNATFLTRDVAGQSHNFHEPGDVDWYDVVVDADYATTIVTYAHGTNVFPSNTVIEVYYDDGTNPAPVYSSNVVGGYEWVTIEAPAYTTFKLKVTDWDGEMGEYDIQAWSGYY